MKYVVLPLVLLTTACGDSRPLTESVSISVKSEKELHINGKVTKVENVSQELASYLESGKRLEIVISNIDNPSVDVSPLIDKIKKEKSLWNPLVIAVLEK